MRVLKNEMPWLQRCVPPFWIFCWTLKVQTSTKRFSSIPIWYSFYFYYYYFIQSRTMWTNAVTSPWHTQHAGTGAPVTNDLTGIWDDGHDAEPNEMRVRAFLASTADWPRPVVWIPKIEKCFCSRNRWAAQVSLVRCFTGKNRPTHENGSMKCSTNKERENNGWCCVEM